MKVGKMMDNVWVFDLDGTMANCDHRLHLIRNKPKQWLQFFLKSIHDEPIIPTVKIYKALRSDPNNVMIILTARPERWGSHEIRELTEQWLFNQDIKYRQLYMRSINDSRDDFIVKSELMKTIEKEHGEIIAGFDDRRQVLENTYHKNGYFVYDVSQGDTVR